MPTTGPGAWPVPSLISMPTGRVPRALRQGGAVPDKTQNRVTWLPNTWTCAPRRGRSTATTPPPSPP
eukprot:146582-Prymnesium_polylepis.1